MLRTWRLLVWTGKKYEEANCGDSTFQATSPKDAIKKAGLYDPKFYTHKLSRKGYGHFTGRVYTYAPETLAAGPHTPADFILEVIPDQPTIGQKGRYHG